MLTISSFSPKNLLFQIYSIILLMFFSNVCAQGRKYSGLKKKSLAIILAFTFIFPPYIIGQVALKGNLPGQKAAENITAEQMRDYLYFVASDEMEGRATPSRGLDLTAKFLAMNLSRWGFKPAGDNKTFFQEIALRRVAADAGLSSIEMSGEKFAYGDDFIHVSGTRTGALSAPVVFVGDGWLVKSKNLNPYQGIDVKGKIVAVYGEGIASEQNIVPLPAGITQADLKGQRGVDYAGPSSYARENGAAGILVLPSKFIRENWGHIRQLFERNQISVEKVAPTQASANPVAATFLASTELANALFSGESINPLSGTASKSFDLSANKKINLNLTLKTEKLTTRNVMAIWEGSDPALKAEMVAVGSHYDHVGTRCNPPAGGDFICNGADDNGSGTVGMLAMAESLAKSPGRPKRSILFVWHTAEEIGLLGSEYFIKYPTVPLDKIIAQLNVDMIGRSRKAGDTNPNNRELTGENEIYVIGSKMMSSELGNVVDSVNKSFLNLNYNFRYDDPQDPNRFFIRADHFHYAVKGIPVAYWFNGVHEDYHGAEDEPEKIDYAKMEKVTRTIFLTMWQLADLKSRPIVDKQLLPELRKR
jgi:hypothetical protein